MNDVATMKIGNGHTYDKDGKRVKIYGYAPRIGKALVNMLKEHDTVQMSALGESSVNNMVKAIAHAQTFLKDEGKEVNIQGFTFGPASMSDTEGKEITGKLVIATLNLK